MAKHKDAARSANDDSFRTKNIVDNIIPYSPCLNVDRSKFIINEFLGSGNFGMVFKGEAHGLFYQGSKTWVAIKTIEHTIEHNSNYKGSNALLSEMTTLACMELHCNVVNLLGACTSNFKVQGQFWLLREYCEHGDLKEFLITHREEIKRGNSEFNCPLLIKWAYEIAQGMKYLESKSIIHGDLAAKNILLGKEWCGMGQVITAKISDLDSSQTHQEHYHKKNFHKLECNTWRWMAIEYLNDGVFHLKSDVWRQVCL